MYESPLTAGTPLWQAAAQFRTPFGNTERTGPAVLSHPTPPTPVTRLRWLGQAGLVVSAQAAAAAAAAETLVIDPYVAPHEARRHPAVLSAAEIAALPGLCLLVTHAHYDHLDAEVLAALPANARLVVPAGIADQAAQGTAARVTALAVGESTAHGPWTITLVPAMHAEHVPPADYVLSDPAAPIFSGFHLDGPLRVYHAGDTLDCPELRAALAGCAIDVALLPVNGRTPEREAQDIAGNLGPAEAVALARDLGAGALIPLHWDMFAANKGDLGALAAALDDPASDPVLVIPAHGRELLFTREDRA
jgi:L-ascorbate metabolism protein UlaG (beta-lactamase superfamily)